MATNHSDPTLQDFGHRRMRGHRGVRPWKYPIRNGAQQSDKSFVNDDMWLASEHVCFTEMNYKVGFTLFALMALGTGQASLPPRARRMLHPTLLAFCIGFWKHGTPTLLPG
ncbi:hypothetical protein PT974_12005 [Cladobotryum mycophilum]|uniref:Uncharacterized protein n=1 Tax=Cladobotryum mycophilum TaxID=491253 RepID=A0ABR0S7W0_9HYPO